MCTEPEEGMDCLGRGKEGFKEVSCSSYLMLGNHLKRKGLPPPQPLILLVNLPFAQGLAGSSVSMPQHRWGSWPKASCEMAMSRTRKRVQVSTGLLDLGRKK